MIKQSRDPLTCSLSEWKSVERGLHGLCQIEMDFTRFVCKNSQISLIHTLAGFFRTVLKTVDAKPMPFASGISCGIDLALAPTWGVALPCQHRQSVIKP